jgi:hypothetical protein
MDQNNMHVLRLSFQPINALFVWLISHQATVILSQNKPATSQQYFYLITNQHQPPAKRTG